MLHLFYMDIRTYRVILELDERHTYHAYVPALPGCHTWGVTLDEAKGHIKDAIELYLADLVESGEAAVILNYGIKTVGA